jgi:hypothetical protein
VVGERERERERIVEWVRRQASATYRPAAVALLTTTEVTQLENRLKCRVRTNTFGALRSFGVHLLAR